MANLTYSHYGSVLKHTDFENTVNPLSYIPYSEEFSVLARPLTVKNKVLHNRIEYQPMEGQDAENGAPTELTFARYRELAMGGAGIIWLEAVAVKEDGKSNPYQLLLNEKNCDGFKRLCENIKEDCMRENGYYPIVIMQMTHSGRYSKPNGTAQPIAAYLNPDTDKQGINVADDEFLKALPQYYEKSAKLASLCGFDGIDLKCCHGYLLSELLSAFDRSGDYGGGLENRTRLLLECACAIDASLSADMLRTSRINAFDGYEGRYSFGKAKNESSLYDLSEAINIIDKLRNYNYSMINVTMGSPYRNPDVSRPYTRGLDKPKSDAIFALSRLFRGASEIKAAFPDIAVVNTGISLLGGLSPFAAAGLVKENMTDFVGFGRMSFAYPTLARDILNGNFEPNKACVACGGCSVLKKNIQKSGCIVRNEYYKGIYKSFKAEELK